MSAADAVQPLTSPRRKHGMAWRKPDSFQLPPPPAPTRWEMLLRELEISEQYAAMAITGHVDAPWIAARLRNWVRQHSGYCFVPEPVLRSMGVCVDDFVFMDGRQLASRHTAPKPQYASDGRSMSGC